MSRGESVKLSGEQFRFVNRLLAALLLPLLPLPLEVIDMLPFSGFTKFGFTMCPFRPFALPLPLVVEDEAFAPPPFEFCSRPPPFEEEEEEDNGHWKLLLLLGDEFRRDDAGMNSGDCGVTWERRNGTKFQGETS